MLCFYMEIFAVILATVAVTLAVFVFLIVFKENRKTKIKTKINNKVLTVIQRDILLAVLNKFLRDSEATVCDETKNLECISVENQVKSLRYRSVVEIINLCGSD